MRSRKQRDDIVRGYDDLVQEYIFNGYQPFFLNFMFNHINASNAQRRDIMISQVGRVHEILTRNIVRKPNSEVWRFLRPIFIGCHDLPVWKREKKASIRDFTVNCGFHFNAIALTPPPLRTDMSKVDQEQLWGRQSRLTVQLDEHLRNKSQCYHNEYLFRIHASRINSGTMADYMLKTFKHGRVSSDSIQVWN